MPPKKEKPPVPVWKGGGGKGPGKSVVAKAKAAVTKPTTVATALGMQRNAGSSTPSSIDCEGVDSTQGAPIQNTGHDSDAKMFAKFRNALNHPNFCAIHVGRGLSTSEKITVSTSVAVGA